MGLITDCWKRKSLLASLSLAGLLLLSPPATGLESVSFELSFQVSQRVQEGKEKPTFTFQAPVEMGNAEVRFQRSGWSHREELGDLSRGQRVRVELEQPSGTYQYRALISGENREYGELSFELSFSVAVVEEIQIEVLRQDVDLGRRHLPIHLNRPVETLKLEVSDEEGNRIVNREDRLGGRYGELNLTWEPRDAVGSVQITAHDVDGYWTSLTLTPYWVEIPHETIRFATGSAEISQEEIPKLEKALEELKETIAEKAADDPEMQLYIAGYTDTVGSAANNLQLSARRARSIARWFQQAELNIPIYYQGFGQEVLAVETPDQTEEAANRRAIYLLGNTPPPTSEPFPRRDWERVR